MANDFNEAERAAVYKAIMLRRDIRRQFDATPIPRDVLMRVLSAAHHAGSVGFMQPWDFILIEDRAIRQRVLETFLQERDRAANLYEAPRRELFLSLKLEGILESVLNLCVTCDRTRGGPHVLGRSRILETDLYSTCCAIQNLWLACRAEGIGVGWVSILDRQNWQRFSVCRTTSCRWRISAWDMSANFQRVPNWSAPAGGNGYLFQNSSMSIIGRIESLNGTFNYGSGQIVNREVSNPENHASDW